MKGIMGCDADLAIGAVIVSGTQTMVVLASVTEEQARESWNVSGIGPLVVFPGERFYEVDFALAPVSSN